MVLSSGASLFFFFFPSSNLRDSQGGMDLQPLGDGWTHELTMSRMGGTGVPLCATGSAVSWKHWVAGSIPGPAQ